MNREKEIVQAALDYANDPYLVPPINDEFTRNLRIALGQAFMAGAHWADKTNKKEE